jgi:hypothetical protein
LCSFGRFQVFAGPYRDKKVVGVFVRLSCRFTVAYKSFATFLPGCQRDLES